MAAYAERIKARWLTALETRDAWRDPIVIAVRTNAAPLRIGAQPLGTGLHLKYQLDCGTARLDEPSLRAALVETLCAEMANRDRPVPGDGAFETAQLPLWLAQGLAAECSERSEELLGGVRRNIPRAPPPGAGDLLRRAAWPADAVARQQFQAEAWVFTTNLLGLPDGPAKLRRYLTALGDPHAGTNTFWSVYQRDFPSAVSLEKWWAVALMEWATALVPQSLTVPETDERLKNILRVHLQEGAGDSRRVVTKHLSDLADHASAAWAQTVAQERALQLELLSSRANPLFLDALRVYRQAVEALLRQKPEPFRQLLAQADLYRQLAMQRAAAISQYLDPFDQ